jgi:hypothetical protein
MAEKKKFLLRIDESLYSSLEKWAADELRSINAQIEYILKDSLRKAGRLKENTTTENKKDTKKNHDTNENT